MQFGKQAHTIVGASLVTLLSIQPFLGFWHHRAFSKSQKRGTTGKIHIWYGRGLMIIGIINIGLGLQFAGQSGGWVIAYSTVAGISCLSYLTAIAYSMFKKKRQGKGGPRVLYAGPAHGSALSLDPLHEWDSPSDQFERARQGEFGSVGNEQFASAGSDQFAKGANEQFVRAAN
jgi:hypothetical protein